jgi:hypothetical protein
MLSKCANSSCSSPFLYLHSGKLFRMDVAVEPPAHKKEDGKKPSRRVEFFWLCNACAARMTLSYKPGIGVVATPIKPAFRAAAASL